SKLLGPEQDPNIVEYPSICIDTDIVEEIARHDFPASSLRRIILTAGKILPEDSLSVHTDELCQFPTLESLLPHLLAYFSVLASCLHTSGNPSASFTFMNRTYSYTASLVEMASQFEWSHVLEYHTLYMNKRQHEMRRGNYSGWGPVDLDIF
ncbi:hypothetical protein F5879DRAFT_765614, partial [Lentinula edodes]